MTETIQPHEIDTDAAGELDVGDTFVLLTGDRRLVCEVTAER